VIEVVPNDPRGGVAMELSESAPDLHLQSDGAAAPPTAEHYVLVNRVDGRRMVGEVIRNPEELDAPAVRFFRTFLLFRPDRDLAGNVPTNIALWLRDSDLIKSNAPATTPKMAP
jgi:hypothetical protein